MDLLQVTREQAEHRMLVEWERPTGRQVTDLLLQYSADRQLRNALLALLMVLGQKPPYGHEYYISALCDLIELRKRGAQPQGEDSCQE